MGWTSTFDHQVSRLESGYRLTISYDLHRTEPISTPSSRQNRESECVAKLLSEWPRHNRMFYRHLYALDDKSRGRPLSLAGMKGRDRAVCQTSNSFCIEAKLFMLFAEVAHDVVDNRGVKRVSSSIDRVYTADGLHLTSHTSFNTKKELLGFHIGKLESLEADSGDIENSSLMEAQEEGGTIKRYHDTTVVLVHMNRLLRFLVLSEIWDHYRSEITEEAPDRGARGVDMMLGQALKAHPKDGELKDMARNAMESASELTDSMKAPMISELVTWYIHRPLCPDQTEFSLDSNADDFLYETAWKTAPNYTANVIANCISSTFDGNENAVVWKRW